MALPQKTFSQLVQDLVTAWSNSVGIVPTLGVGDALFAIFQATAAQLDFIQSQIELVNNIARDQTSTGADLDTFFAQFGFAREGAQMAESPDGVFSRLTPAPSQILIPAGTIVQTTGGAIQYVVIADTTQPTWSAPANAYVLAIGQSSLDATIQAVTAGTASNVSANQLNQIASSLPGIDSFTNSAPITNGADAESDTSARVSFVDYLNSLSKATLFAILTAANSVRQGLQIVPLENTASDGSTLLGSFTLVVDDGTGSPPSSLITAIYNAVYLVRAFTVQPFVRAPSVVTANIAIAIKIDPSFNSTAVQNNVKNAIAAVVNASAIGGPLYISEIEESTLAVAGVISVKPANTTINSSTSDLTSLSKIQAARTTTTDISVSTY